MWASALFGEGNVKYVVGKTGITEIKTKDINEIMRRRRILTIGMLKGRCKNKL